MYGDKNMKKAISPLIAAVILVAVVFTIGILMSSSFTSIFKTQIDSSTNMQKCSTTPLELIYYTCTSDTIKATISNIGKIDISNFSIFAEINGNVYTNSTPLNYQTTLTPGSITTLEAVTSYNGPISKLRISAGGDCPGVYIEINNDTKAIGTC